MKKDGKKTNEKDNKKKFGKYRTVAVLLLLLSAGYFLKNMRTGSLSFFWQGGIKNYLMAAFFPAAIFLFVRGKTLEENEAKKKRTEDIKKAYPEFALKVSMLIRAGFTPRGAFEKIGRNYIKKQQREKTIKNDLYEEVVYSIREMQSGTSEKDAYEHFEKRCGVFEISRFSGLLIRAVKRGGSGLSGELKEESNRAVAALRESVRKQSEKAGTKLLFPMVLYLLIVMVMILYPAFETFSSF